jgi:hypothetical protein
VDSAPSDGPEDPVLPSVMAVPSPGDEDGRQPEKNTADRPAPAADVEPRRDLRVTDPPQAVPAGTAPAERIVEPRVVIGRIDVYVESEGPRPAATPRERRGLASRRYWRGV